MRIENLEIFRAGDYGEKGSWTPEHIAAIAASYDPKFHEAPVTVDHAQSGPALGWVKRLIARGRALIAELELEDGFFGEVRAGKWKKRSAEIYPDLGGKGPYLRAVSFLGAMAPEVKGLADVAFDDAGEERVFINYDERISNIEHRILNDEGKDENDKDSRDSKDSKDKGNAKAKTDNAKVKMSEKKNGRDGGGDPDDGGEEEMSVKTLKEALAGKEPEEVAAFFAEGLGDDLLGVKTFGEFVTAQAGAAVKAAFEKAGLDEKGQPKKAAVVEMAPEVAAKFAESEKARVASEARVIELEKKDFARDLDVKFSEQIRKGRLTPAIAKPLKALAGVLKFSAAGEQTVTFSEKDKDGKVTTTEHKAGALVDQVLAAMPQFVKMGEIEQPDLPETSGGTQVRPDGTTLERADLDAEVKAFAEKHSVNGKPLEYGEAYRQVVAMKASR